MAGREGDTLFLLRPRQEAKVRALKSDAARFTEAEPSSPYTVVDRTFLENFEVTTL